LSVVKLNTVPSGDSSTFPRRAFAAIGDSVCAWVDDQDAEPGSRGREGRQVEEFTNVVVASLQAGVQIGDVHRSRPAVLQRETQGHAPHGSGVGP
jgi:hypothetical protein